MTKINFVFVLAVVLALFTVNTFAQDPHTLTLEDGTKFTPTPQQQSTPSGVGCCPGSSQPCCLGPLDKRAAQVVDEFLGTRDELGRLPGTDPSAPATKHFGWSSPDPILFLLLFGLAVIASMVAVILHFRHQVAPVVPPPVGPHIPVNFAAQPLNVGFVGGQIQLGVIQQPVVPAAQPPVVAAPVPGPAVAVAPAVAPAPAAFCPNCGQQRANAVARFCQGCGAALPLILLALLLFGFGQATARAENVIKYYCTVSGIQGLCEPPAKPVVAPAPAPKTVPPVIHHTPRPAAPPPTRVLSAEERELMKAMTGLVKKIDSLTGGTPATSSPSAPTPSASSSQAPAASVTSVQAIAERLGKVEARLNDGDSRLNQLTSGLGEVRQRLTNVENNEAQDRATIVDVGTAALTHSKRNSCTAYTRLLNQGQIDPDKKLSKQCGVQ